MLKCPVCKNTDMIILEHNEIEIDYCLSCRGIWLDKGELELLMEMEPGKEITARLFREINQKDAKEKKRRCPICKKEMKKVNAVLNEGKKVMVDLCPSDHGIWFDNGELYEIICNSVEEDMPVLDFLKSIFSEDNLCDNE